MPDIFAICPYCNKTILVESTSHDTQCAFCGANLSYKMLEEKEALIDLNESNEHFKDAKLYFDNTDFRSASEYFAKALKANPNHYLSYYFFGLCDAYDNGDREDYNVPKALVKTLKGAIEKMENSQIELKYKTSFVCAALNEIYIILLSNYNKLCAKLDNSEERKNFRKSCIAFLGAVNELHAMDKEKLLVFDPGIAAQLVSITDICITACFRSTMPHLSEDNILDIPADFEYNIIRNYYANFITYATTLDPKYSAISHTVDYSENLQYNKEVLLLIDRYYTLNKDNNKKLLSLTGDILSNLNKQCSLSVMLTYHTCVHTFAAQKNDALRVNITNQAIIICYERLKPRLYIDDNKRVCVIFESYANMRKLTVILDEMLDSLPDNMKKSSNDVMDLYFQEVYDTINLYYGLVNKSYSKIVNKLKRLKNDEYLYYQNFLFQMSSCCAIALCDMVNYTGKKMKNRINLLKLCKIITEEFLLLCDYRIEEIESSEKYSDIFKIYSMLDNDIETLQKI